MNMAAAPKRTGIVTIQADREPSRIAARSRLREGERDLIAALPLWPLRAGTARGRALERERALEGESPSVAVLPATS